jgi:hypothetical protein
MSVSAAGQGRGAGAGGEKACTETFPVKLFAVVLLVLGGLWAGYHHRAAVGRVRATRRVGLSSRVARTGG